MAKAKQHSQLTPDELADRGIPLGESGGPQDDGPPPKYGTPTVAEIAGPEPRVCRELDRAPAGLKRFKIRADPGGFKNTYRYVLARTRDEAEAHYRQVEQLGQAAALVIFVLPD